MVALERQIAKAFSEARAFHERKAAMKSDDCTTEQPWRS
jgi:hypothetical protein